MSEKFASLTASSLQVEDAIEYGTMGNFSRYDNSYLNMEDGALRLISSIPGESASTYASFSDEGFFNEIEVYEAAGGDGGDPYAEALIDVETFLFYLDTAADGESVTIEFHGEEGSQLASQVEIKGSLKASVYLPTSQQILEQIPLWLPQAFTSDGNYKPGDKQLETKVDTEVRELQRIVDVVDSEQVRGINEYPVVVDDGEFRLEAIDENSRNSLAGSLNAAVEGPDFANTYQTGFEAAVNVLSGEVTVRSSPGGAPICITKKLDGGTVRNVLGHTGSL